jgi:hypothetical protein
MQAPCLLFKLLYCFDFKVFLPQIAKEIVRLTTAATAALSQALQRTIGESGRLPGSA